MLAVELAIFAKAPRPGFAKTRMVPALGPAGAARLQRRLTLETLSLAARYGLARTTLWCAPDSGHRFFRALESRLGMTLRNQIGDDLGQRMANAFERHEQPMLLIGTDCPALTVDHLSAASQALCAGDDAVFIPAEDGGYVLVGLRRPQPEVFEGIAWGSDAVMAQTRERLSALNLRWSEPATLWDVDRPKDLPRLATLAAFAQDRWAPA